MASVDDGAGAQGDAHRSVGRAGPTGAGPEPGTPERGRRLGKVVTSGAFLVASLGFLLLSFDYPVMTAGENPNIGPGLLPRLIGFALVCTTALSFLKDLRDPGSDVRWGADTRDVFVMIGLTIAFVLGMRVIGALIAMPLFMFATLMLYNRAKPVQNTLVSLGVTAVIYGLLVAWLNAPFPGGYLNLAG